jgi:glycosyltransferase involved in cell wall biosynthesis
MQFHVLSFEGVDAYSRVGGLATRVDGLTEALAAHGFNTHLWFVGDPDAPGHESRGSLHLHRWCQWLSHYHDGGVYDGEHAKAAEYAASLPPFLLQQSLLPHLVHGGHAVVVAEEWQTVNAVLHLDSLLREARLRDQVSIFWNANNTYGFELIDWQKLSRAATITAVSRYMKHCMQRWGVDAVVIPNGLSPDAYDAPEQTAVKRFRQAFRDRMVVAKMARWDPDKRWLGSIDVVGELKRHGWRPLFVARGGTEPHGEDVMAAAHAAGLRVTERYTERPGAEALLASLTDVDDIDVVSVKTPVDPEARRVLFRGADAVLANSSHEPFGLVGLETMAVGGIACTGCSGEDYAIPGRNALVLQTDDPREFLGLYRQLRESPNEVSAMRRAGMATARQYAWTEVIRRNLLPRLELERPNAEPAFLAMATDRAFATPDVSERAVLSTRRAMNRHKAQAETQVISPGESATLAAAHLAGDAG